MFQKCCCQNTVRFQLIHGLTVHKMTELEHNALSKDAKVVQADTVHVVGCNDRPAVGNDVSLVQSRTESPKSCFFRSCQNVVLRWSSFNPFFNDYLVV